MSEDQQKQDRLKFLKALKRKGKSYPEFELSLTCLQDAAAARGLEEDEIDLILDVIMNTDLGSTKLISLVKCLIPRYKVSDKVIKDVINWWFSSLNDLPITASIILIQWIIGLWNYQLVDRKVINIYYDAFFFTMLRRDRLEKLLAYLIYGLTKPEDVSRRNVSRLLNLQQKYSKPQTHIIALLSLFKSYKPELVPEKIQSMNIESVWKPIPEVLRLGFEDARDRVEVQQTLGKREEHFDWNVTKKQSQKAQKILLPSVGYFKIGSSIFKDKDAKSIFDISNTEDLGKHHLSVELPCNALSLLANSAGYHLLTYADFQYQSRFSYNLYNTLRRAFILESEKFSQEQKDRLLDMTIEFSRYMQQGVMVVNLFIDEYLYFNTEEHRLKFFSLLEWITCVSTTELQEKILIHVQHMFFELSLKMKCELIKSFRRWAMNLFVSQGYDECYHDAPSPFLGQGPIDGLQDVFPVFTTIVGDMIVAGLNAHSYNVLLLSEALAFYEEISMLESRSSLLSWTVAPPAVIYGAFVTGGCAMLSRVLALLLRYRDVNTRFGERRIYHKYKEKINIVTIYAEDIFRSLWFNEAFSKRDSGYFLRNLPEKIVEDLADCDLDSQLNVSNHFAVLPYKFTLSKTGLNINTKEDSLSVALHYYPALANFINAFLE